MTCCVIDVPLERRMMQVLNRYPQFVEVQGPSRVDVSYVDDIEPHLQKDLVGFLDSRNYKTVFDVKGIKSGVERIYHVKGDESTFSFFFKLIDVYSDGFGSKKIRKIGLLGQKEICDITHLMHNERGEKIIYIRESSSYRKHNNPLEYALDVRYEHPKKNMFDRHPKQSSEVIFSVCPSYEIYGVPIDKNGDAEAKNRYTEEFPMKDADDQFFVGHNKNLSTWVHETIKSNEESIESIKEKFADMYPPSDMEDAFINKINTLDMMNYNLQILVDGI